MNGTLSQRRARLGKGDRLLFPPEKWDLQEESLSRHAHAPTVQAQLHTANLDVEASLAEPRLCVGQDRLLLLALRRRDVPEAMPTRLTSNFPTLLLGCGSG